MRKVSSLLRAAALLVSVAAAPASAQDWHHDHEHGGDGHWHGDIHYFHERDYNHWRGGNWFNGFHEGRNGWWWIVDGLWYFYPAPIYPYPDPYTPPGVVAGPVPVTPYGIAPTYIYYCRDPVGYYPYVPACFRHWERMLAASAAPAPVVMQPQPVAPPAMAPAPMMVQPQPAPMPPPQAMAPAPVGGQREADDRQLNAYAVTFQNINPADPRARAKLRNLEKKIEAFRQALYARGYNAMDILRDADGLEHRVAAERQKLPMHPVAPPPVLTAPPPQ